MTKSTRLEPRLFTKRQRENLFIRSKGLCEKCKKDLNWSFHADHIYPFSLGGKTNTNNGQALCPQCNLKKGNRFVHSDIKKSLDNFRPREWQNYAFEAVQTDLGLHKSSLLVANPGAGKTLFAGMVLANGMLSGAFERCIVVSPTSALKVQWLNELWANFKISLELDRPRESAGGDFHGVSVTYQGLAASAENFKAGCEQIGRTLVILDEPHHAGENKSWGDAIETAFNADGVKVLLLTGTPWRTDGLAIPFAPYDKNNNLKPAFSYGFSQAIKDQVNRAPRFFTFDADKVSWLDLDTGEHHEKNTLELSDETDSNRAYRSALEDPETIERMFKAADEQITYLRNHEDLRAGGLLIAKDLKAAEAARSMIEIITGQSPRIVHNDIPNPQAVIEEFKNSLDRWIVAVEMITEGIDIKRLRCCIYAHRAKTELFIRQVVGRFTRRYAREDEIDDQFGYMFMLQNKLLMELAEKIEQETLVAVKDLNIGPCSGMGGGDGLMKGILGTGANLIDGDGVVGGRRIDRQALAYVRKIINSESILLGMDLMQAVHLMEVTGRLEKELAQGAKRAAEKEKEEESPDTKKDKLRKEYTNIVRRFVRDKFGKDAPKYYSETFKKFNRVAGFVKVDDASIEQLQGAIDMVRQELTLL